MTTKTRSLAVLAILGLFSGSTAFADACGNSLVAYCGVPGAKTKSDGYVFSGWKKSPTPREYVLPVAKSSFDESSTGAGSGNSTFDEPQKPFKYLGRPYLDQGNGNVVDDDSGTGAIREGQPGGTVAGGGTPTGAGCSLIGNDRHVEKYQDGDQVRAYKREKYTVGLPYSMCSDNSAVLTCANGSWGDDGLKFRYSICQVGSESSMDHDEAYHHAQHQTDPEPSPTGPVRKPSKTNDPAAPVPLPKPDKYKPVASKPLATPPNMSKDEQEFFDSDYFQKGPNTGW